MKSVIRKRKAAFKLDAAYKRVIDDPASQFGPPSGCRCRNKQAKALNLTVAARHAASSPQSAGLSGGYRALDRLSDKLVSQNVPCMRFPTIRMPDPFLPGPYR